MQEEAKQSGEWVIGRIASYAAVCQQPHTKWDEWMLRHGSLDLIAAVEAKAETDSPWAAARYDRELQAGFQRTFNNSVKHARNAITYEKTRGARTVAIRPGLSLPTAWQSHYEAIYMSDLPWLVSAVLQSAFMGHPPFGEKKPWQSP